MTFRIVAGILFLYTVQHLEAGQLPLVEVTETMMSAISGEEAAVGVALGPDAASDLQFSSFVDPNALSFSFSTLPGQIYLGMSVSLTTTGSFNGGDYTWSSAGTVGASAWSDSGAAAWSGDPDETISQNITLGGVLYALKGAITTTTDPSNDRLTDSSGDFVFYDINDNFLGGTSGKDTYDMTTNRWTFNFQWVPADRDCSDPCFLGAASGSQGADGGAGSFDFRATPVPEPSTLLFTGTILVALRLMLRSRSRWPLRSSPLSDRPLDGVR
jgi:hypothetical protein